MRKPNLKTLKVQSQETRRIREAMSKQKSVKITINIDSELLATLKGMASKTGIPYQRLLNRTLAEGLHGKNTSDQRLERIERELKLLKKKIAA